MTGFWDKKRFSLLCRSYLKEIDIKDTELFTQVSNDLEQERQSLGLSEEQIDQESMIHRGLQILATQMAGNALILRDIKNLRKYATVANPAIFEELKSKAHVISRCHVRGSNRCWGLCYCLRKECRRVLTANGEASSLSPRFPLLKKHSIVCRTDGITISRS